MIIHSKLAHASIFNVDKQLLNVIYKSQSMLYDCHVIILLAIVQKKQPQISHFFIILFLVCVGWVTFQSFGTLGRVRGLFKSPNPKYELK